MTEPLAKTAADQKLWRRQERRNSWRLWLAGLPRHSGAITPYVPDDRYQTLASVYRFAGAFARGCRTLDLSCGTGFGAVTLHQAGATSVLGLESVQWAIRHARRKHRREGIDFRLATPDALPDDLGQFDMALAINLLPRYHDVETVLEGICHHLDQGASLMTSVPVAATQETLTEQLNSGHLATQLFPWYWAGILGSYFERVRTFRHLPPRGCTPIFESPFPSTLSAEAFEWHEIQPEDLRQGENLAALFLCEDLR